MPLYPLGSTLFNIALMYNQELGTEVNYERAYFFAKIQQDA